MKLLVTQVLKQRNGEPIKDGDSQGKIIEATLRMAIINALESTLESDKNEQPIKKYERSKLADRVYENNEVELSVEEIAQIKDRIGKVYNSYIVKLCWDLLETK
jgi:hypothetical protein